MTGKRKILGISLAIILMAMVFVPGGKIAATPRVSGAFDSPFLWPSAHTAIPLHKNAYRYGTQPPINTSYILNFWATHFDFLLDGRPYSELKAINPNIRNMPGDSLSYGTWYKRPESASGEAYGYKMLDMKNWVETHWQEYPWASQYADAADAYEDCFIHVNQDTVVRFVKTATTYTVPAYDSANPKPSRLPGPWDIDYDWMMNVGSPVYVSYWQDHRIQQLGAEDTAAVFLDSTGVGWIHLWVYPTRTVEYNVNNNEQASRLDFENDIRLLTGLVQTNLHSAYPDKKVAINDYIYFEVGISPPKFNFQDQADILWRENGIWQKNNSTNVKNEVEAAARATAEGKIVVEDQSVDFCDSVSICPDVNPWDNATCMACVNRDRIAGLAAYYLMMNDNIYFASVNDKFYANSVYTQDDPAVYSWFGAMGYDIGKPAGDYQSDWASGTDPSQPTLTYYVFARRFTRALVLFKAKPAGSPVYGVYGDNTATTHQLDGTYRTLNADGTLGDPITSITLRNWEGAILIENDLTAPGTISDLTAQ